MAPTCGSFSSAVFTRAVIVASSIVSPIVFPHAANISGSSHAIVIAAAVRRTSCLVIMDSTSVVVPCNHDADGRSLKRAPSSMAQLSGSADDVEAGVHHQDLTGDRTAGRTEQKHGGIGNLGELHVAPQWRTVPVHLKDVRES